MTRTELKRMLTRMSGKQTIERTMPARNVTVTEPDDDSNGASGQREQDIRLRYRQEHAQSQVLTLFITALRI